MSIFTDKKFMAIIELAELSMEILNKQADWGFYHKVQPRLDTIRGHVNKVNQKYGNDERQYYNRVIERGLDKAKSSLEKNGFQQPEIYDLYELSSHVKSLIN